MNLDCLSTSIGEIDRELSQSANRAVNTLLTSRNWLIGFYIVEYEHDGEDRAKYGESLTKELAKRLDTKGLSARNLWLFRQFYLAYPQIGTALSESPRIVQTVSALSRKIPQSTDNQSKAIVQSPVALSETHQVSDLQEIMNPLSALSGVSSDSQPNQIVQSPIALLANSSVWLGNLQKLHPLHVPGAKLMEKISYTHLSLLLPIENHLKRTFYEIEAIKGTWSVRELKRQISSLYFERSGLSDDPVRLSQMTLEKPPPTEPRHLTKDLYTFEFLGLPGHLAVEESDLETALLDHLQEFLLELGHGFCLEARQKRLLIGDEYFFIDLVFYHRLLKCHVIVELKVGGFSHENAGQLNTYLNYYRAEIMQPDDNPPVGILLVAEKNNPLVQYATAGMNENLFVKKYLLQLPSTADLKNFLNQELNQL